MPESPELVDIIIANGTLITMDLARQVINDGAVAIAGDRIVAVGQTRDVLARHRAERMLDASHKIVMPGLIDGHGHAGHGLVKTLGVDRPGGWQRACETIYAEGSTEEFWYVDGLRTALERLKFGVTCGVTFFGGGGAIPQADMAMRTDDPVYGDRHCEAVQQVGVREFLTVGPRCPPFPRRYVQWQGNHPREVLVSFDDQLAVCETLIKRWHRQADGRLTICLMFHTHHPDHVNLDGTIERDLRRQAQLVREMTKAYDVLFTQDSHTRGTVKYAHEELDLLGPDALLSHATELTDEEIDICRRTDTRIVHNPSAIASILGRCPVPELLDAGVIVALGSDAPSPDRSCDMFRHMFQATRYHRFFYRDPSYLPAGKVLEMVTIDAARALSVDDDLGSLEPGKKADVIVVDAMKPHIAPLNMPVHRVVYYANGNDVETVLVDGRIVMEERAVKTVDETDVVRRVQEVTDEMLDRLDLRELAEIPDRFWGHSKY